MLTKSTKPIEYAVHELTFFFGTITGFAGINRDVETSHIYFFSIIYKFNINTCWFIPNTLISICWKKSRLNDGWQIFKIEIVIRLATERQRSEVSISCSRKGCNMHILLPSLAIIYVPKSETIVHCNNKILATCEHMYELPFIVIFI